MHFKKGFSVKLIALILVALNFSSAYAGDNKLEMKKEGLYIGKLENGQACSIEVFEIKKTFITRRLKSMKAEVSVHDFQKEIALECGYDMENGTSCQAKIPSFSILLFTRTGHTADDAPDFHFTYRGKTETCSDLMMIK